jgi:high-affinity iron transporter
MAELIIVFREVLEASLIIGILYTYLNKTGNQEAISSLWKGVIYAIIASIIGSFFFQIIAGGFYGQSEKLFEGFVMIFAAIILSTMVIWMAKKQNIAEDLKEKANDIISNDKSTLFLGGIAGLAFISVFREGIETILFLYGIILKEGSISIFMALFGAFLGLLSGYMIFIQGRKIPLKKFFNVTSVLLIFVASGMLAYGFHELESAGIIPDSGRIWDINPVKFSDGSYPLLHDKGYVGSLIKGLFGYNGDPSILEFLVWLFTTIGLLFVWNKARSKK